MQFIILEKKKIIFFWSAKCGCSTLKTILARYLHIDNPEKYKNIHLNEELKNLFDKYNKEKNYKNYDIVMLIRNPYKRLVSGFLNKYVNRLHYKNPPNSNCFKDFCHILYKNPDQIDKHHFEKQTTGKGWIFYNYLGKPKIKYVLDTKNVNDITNILGLNITYLKLNYTIYNNKKKMLKTCGI